MGSIGQQYPIILDGGMSRELIRLNAPFRQPEWSALALMEAPHLVKQVHCEFAAAGADVITTNSYALVPFHIGAQRFAEQGEELAALSGRLAREAADQERARSGRKVLVAGSLPPIFGSYEPDLFDANSVQAYLEVLVRGLAPFVDVWLGETLSLIAEGKAVESAVKGTGKPFWIAFTLDDREDEETGKGSRRPACLRSGETVADAAKWALSTRAESLLFNCSRPEVMGVAVQDAKVAMSQQGRDIPIGIYANAFEAKSETRANEVITATRRELTSEPYTAFAQEWVAAGASMVGGCCGIGCDHIKQLAQVFLKESKI